MDSVVALVLGGRLAAQLRLQQVFRKDQKGDPHQGKGHAPLTITGPFEGARGLEMLRPAQAHVITTEILIIIKANPDCRVRLHALKH
jgi:hypothetical protein